MSKKLYQVRVSSMKSGLVELQIEYSQIKKIKIKE